MFGIILAVLAIPAVQVGTFIVGFVPGAAAMVNMFRKKNKTNKPTYKSVKITAYGWHDNDPPSAQIAFPILHKEASGVGTYDDPVTCAADPRQIEKGTIIYIPRFQKYFLMEDSCGAAISQDRHKPPILDLWIGGKHSTDKDKLTAQEATYTLDKPETVILYPVNTLTVNVAPLFRG
jgi:3D (Asp-Asp-Asp) domain-containing protein